MEIMTKTIDETGERQTALDNFAKGSGQDVSAPAAFHAPAAADRVFGAQQLAVHRDEGKVLQKLAALGAAAGDDWYYRFPVKNRKANRTDWIEGPSIKLANDLARIYGNCDVDTRVTDLGDSWLIYARFIDLESGYALVRPFQQRKGASQMGGADDARRLDISFQIGVSKAIRNVTVNALQTFADYAFQEARNSLIERVGKNLEAYRDKIKDRVENDLQIDLARVETVRGRAIADWIATDVAMTIAEIKAIQDGMATVDDTFPAAASEKPESKMDEFANDKPKAAEGSEAVPAGEDPQPDMASSKGGGSSDQDETDPLQIAHVLGVKARQAGKSRKSLPPKYRSAEMSEEKSEWLAGFDEADDEIAKADEAAS
jgi:ribosome modulation factor